jgi:hypothetical protein
MRLNELSPAEGSKFNESVQAVVLVLVLVKQVVVA